MDFLTFDLLKIFGLRFRQVSAFVAYLVSLLDTNPLVVGYVFCVVMVLYFLILAFIFFCRHRTGLEKPSPRLPVEIVEYSPVPIEGAVGPRLADSRFFVRPEIGGIVDMPIPHHFTLQEYWNLWEAREMLLAFFAGGDNAVSWPVASLYVWYNSELSRFTSPLGWIRVPEPHPFEQRENDLPEHPAAAMVIFPQLFAILNFVFSVKGVVVASLLNFFAPLFGLWWSLPKPVLQRQVAGWFRQPFKRGEDGVVYREVIRDRSVVDDRLAARIASRDDESSCLWPFLCLPILFLCGVKMAGYTTLASLTAVSRFILPILAAVSAVLSVVKFREREVDTVTASVHRYLADKFGHEVCTLVCGFWTKGRSLIGALGRAFESLRGRRVLTGFGKNKSQFKLAKEPMTFRTWEFDRVKNSYLIHGSSRRPELLRRLRGKSEFTWQGKVFIVDYPIRAKGHLVDFLRRGGDPSTILSLERIDLKTLAYFCQGFRMHGTTLIDADDRFFGSGPILGAFACYALMTLFLVSTNYLLSVAPWFLPVACLLNTLAWVLMCLGNMVMLPQMCVWSSWLYLIPVMAEEIAKIYLGLGVGVAELVTRFNLIFGGDLRPILPFIMHVCVEYIPLTYWWVRVLIHAAWNYWAIEPCSYRCVGSMPWSDLSVCQAMTHLQLLDKTMDITRIGQLVLLAVERNFKQFILSLHNFGYVKQLLSFFENRHKTIEDVVEQFSEWMTLFQPTAGEGILSLLSKILPRNIGRSPTVMAAVAVASCLLSSLFLGSYERLMEFLPLVDFSSMKTGEVVAVAVDASLTIVRSATAAYQSGNLWDFFVKPKLFKLRYSLMHLCEKQDLPSDDERKKLDKLEEEALYANDPISLGWVAKVREKFGKLESDSAVLGVIAEAMELVGRKPESLVENEVLRDSLRAVAKKPLLARQTALLSKIYERIEALEKNANGSKSRRPPLTLVLLGVPGTGKTALYDQIIQFYAGSSGQTIDKSHVTRIQLESKHPVEGAFPNTKVLIINDMVADHSKGLQTTSFSVGALLQSIMDSEPLKFPSASVAGKGVSFPDVELFIITTNERCFVMPESTERLQRRFDELAIVVDVAIVDDHGRPMVEKDFALLSVRERNERTKAQMLGVVCTGKNYSFTIKRSHDFVPIKWFWLFLKEKISAKRVKEDKSSVVMSTTCKCGILHYSHYVGGVWSPIVDGLCEEVELSALPSGAEICSCRLLKNHPFNPIWDHGLDSTRQLEVKPSLMMPRRVSFSGGSGTLAPTSLVIDVVWYAGLAWVFWTLFSLCRGILEMLRVEVERAAGLMDEIGIRVLEFLSSYDRLVGKVSATKMKVVAQYLRARAFLRKYKYVIGLSSIMLLAYKLIPSSNDVTAKIVVRENVDKQSMVIDSFSQEVTYPPGVAKEWNKVPMMMPVVELSAPGASACDLERKVRANTVQFSVQDASTQKFGYLLVLNATLAISNVHYFFEKDGRSKEVLLEMKGMKVFISAIDVFRIARSECVLIRHAMPGVWRDLLPCFADELTVKQLKCRYAKDGDDYLTVISDDGFMVGSLACEGPTWRSVKEAPDGDCGQCMIGSSTKGNFILGIVSFREASSLPWGPVTQGGNVLFKGQLVETIGKMAEPVARSFSMTAYEKELETLSVLPNHSSFRTLVSPFIQILGSKGTDDKKFNSSLKETGFAPFVRERGLLKKKYGIPRRISKVENGVFKSAFLKTVSEINYSGFLPSSHLRDACHEYLVHVLNGVRKVSGDIVLSPLSLEDSFFGQAAQNVTRCNFKTSIGPEDREFFKTRNDLFADLDGQYVLASSFRDKLQETLDLLRQGDVKVPWISGSYKDEVRSEEKLREMSIRLFYTVDIYNNTLARMYLVPLASCLLDHPFVSRCFGKMNSGSKEWDDFVMWLKQHPNVLDLDFKHYDISHAQRIMREVAYFFYRLAQHWYKDEESALIVYLLVFALSCQLFEHKGDFALKFKGLPSGHIVTLILNSVANVILMVTAFKMEYPRHSFWEETRGGVVGDDNVTSVSDSVKAKFNLVELVNIYAEWGYEVTDAAKSGSIKPFTTFEDVQFLKRKFRFDTDVGEFVAPLEKDSIYKMLSYWTAKGSGTTYEQRMSDCFEVAQREMFLWGRNEFDAFRELFKPEVDRQKTFLVRWFDFDELLVEYKEGSEAFMHWTSRVFKIVEPTSSICQVEPRLLRSLSAATTTLGAGKKYADSWNQETDLQEKFSLAELNQPENVLSVEVHAPNDAVAAPEHEHFRSYRPDKSNTFVVDEYSGFATQPVLFAAANWTTSSLDTVVSEDLFKSFVTIASGSTYLWRKLANFMFVDSMLTVTVVVQGSSVAQGKIIYSFDPTPKQVPAPALGTRLPEAQKTRAYLLPHIEINPAESKTYTIDLPAPTVWGVYSLSKNSSAVYDLGSYRMKQHIINGLGSGTATVPEIGITIYLSLKGGSLSSKTVTTSFTSLTEEKTSPSGGVLSKLFRKGADIASYGSYVPIPAIAEASTLFSAFASGTADLLSWFGFSKPLIYNHQSSWIRPINNLGRIDGNVQSELLSWRTNNSVSIAMQDFPLGNPNDLVVANLCAKDGLVKQFQCSTSAVPDTLLTSIPITPTLSRYLNAPIIEGSYELTPLGFCAVPFMYWRGDIVITIESVCSVFHRATLLVLHDPGGGYLSTPYIDKAPALQHWTMAVNGCSKMEFRIPWKQIEHFKEIVQPTDNDVADGNGVLSVVLLNALTTNGSTDPIMFNVFMRGEDMAFGGVSARSAPVPLVLTALQKTNDVHFFGKYFGEEHPHTLKEMASRFTLQAYAQVTVPVGPVENEALIANIPVGSMLCSAVNGGTKFLSLVDYVSSAFVGTRGSYNYSYFPDYGGSREMTLTVARPFVSTGSDASISASGTTFPSASWTPISYAYHDINPSIDVTLPHYFDGLFRPTYYRTGGAGQPVLRLTTSFRGDVAKNVEAVPTLYKSGGDDFTLLGFRGIPIMAFS